MARGPAHEVEQAWRAYNGRVMPPARNELDLFKPGPGGLPPYLAGREREQQIFRAFLDCLRQAAAPPRDLILYGPRGNGKTTLLSWLHEGARERDAVDVIHLTPAAIPTEERLVRRLLSPTWWRRLLPGEVSISGVRWRAGQSPDAPSLDEVLAARTGRKPLLLLLDEAHTLDAGVGYALLNAGQIVGRKQPFLLALAGTPHLESRLSEMDVSFWSRSELLPIGRLDAAATADALRLPLAGENVAVDDDALAELVASSQGYPYFVQLLGEALWRRVVAGGASAGRRITRTDVEAVRADFEQKKGRYYLQRYNELQEQGLLPAARAVAEAFEERERLDGAQLQAAVRRGLGERGDEKRSAATAETLGHLGYIWRPDAVPTWEAGIPSLMDYVRTHTPAAERP